MQHYLEIKQHGNTVLFTIAKVLIYHSAEQYSDLPMISLDFNEAVQSTPPVLTHIMLVLRTFLTSSLPKHQFVGLVSILHVKGILLVLHRPLAVGHSH